MKLLSALVEFSKLNRKVLFNIRHIHRQLRRHQLQQFVVLMYWVLLSRFMQKWAIQKSKLFLQFIHPYKCNIIMKYLFICFLWSADILFTNFGQKFPEIATFITGFFVPWWQWFVYGGNFARSGVFISEPCLCPRYLAVNCTPKD